MRVGHARVGLKPCLPPLLAVIGEARLVARFWRQPGNVHCANNLIAFTLDLLSNLPRHLWLRLIRADSGFHHGP